MLNKIENENNPPRKKGIKRRSEQLSPLSSL